MMDDKPGPGRDEMRILHHDLMKANDEKIVRVVEMVDSLPAAEQAQAMLDPLRGRLAALRPVRPLRLSRLLFIPLDPLIVPARQWRPGDPSVPRSVLASISKTVEAGLGESARAIRTTITGHKTDAAQVIAAAGAVLWPRAADILRAAPPPVAWDETELRIGAYPALARALAAVLRRAAKLRLLARDAEIGAVACDEQAVAEILVGLAEEPPEGRAMVVRLILGQAPHAAPLLRQIVAMCRDGMERRHLQQAVAAGVDQVLTTLEHRDEVTDGIRRGALGSAGLEVRRLAALLTEVEHDTAAPQHRPRLKAIRARLDEACRARLEDGVQEGLAAPLAAAAAPVDGTAQTELETCARDLRALESVARRFGNAGDYDSLLRKATDVVQAAGQSGTLTPVRKLRLVEILAGADAAEALYEKEVVVVPGTRS
jgi:hypothetical protein